MRRFYDLTLSSLEEELVSNGFKKFNATQVFEGIYKQKHDNFLDITNISKELKKFLSENYDLSYFKVLDKLESDTANKYLLELEEDTIEVVLMKQSYGDSLCISSQVGCNMNCAFCESGRLKKVRNLTAGEMILEVITIEKLENIRIDNVVIMGIGEPFDNFDNVKDFLNIVTCNKGIDLGSRKITVSTCGLVPKIREFADLDLQVNLAISLHAPNDNIRNKMMPINRAYPIKEVMSAVDYYIQKTNRRVTIEYILLDGINDSKEQAIELANLLKGKLVYVNLIPFNTNSSDFKRSSKNNIEVFFDTLTKMGINTQKRREMGKNIKGACGQLKAIHEMN